MKFRIPMGGAIMLAAILLSVIPAATVSTQSAAAWSTCDWAQFVADVTVPDGTAFAPGAAFTKTWRLKNIGTCTWTTSYALVFDTGDRLGGPTAANLPNSVAPGQTVDVSIGLTAPAGAGHYIGYWKFKNASGVLFGIGSTADKSWWVEINVSGTSGGVAYDFAANFCSATWSSLQGSLPCPGTDGDSRGFVLKVNNPQLENGVADTGSGLITTPQNVFNGDIHGAYPAFHVQSGDRFQSIVNCAFGATSCYVTFRLDYQIGAGPINTLWSFREKYEGLYFRTNLDLSSLAGQDVKFILTVLATGSAAGDRALWSNPVILRAGSVPPPPPSGTQKYDFGTASSPVAAGYVRVTESTAFTSGAFGWTDTSGLESRDRSDVSDDVKRDFVLDSTAARTFKTTLPNGTYSVTVTMGDKDSAHDNMVVKANAATMLADVDTAAGAFAANTFNVTVSASLLALEFSDAGGADPTWVVNSVSIAPSAPPPPAACDRAQFISDVTVPDGTVFTPGATFGKTWRLKNVGTCTWSTSYLLVFDSGEHMGGPDSVNLPNAVAPGQSINVSVNLTAPGSAGSYRGFWKFQNASGVRFGIGVDGTKSWWVDIKVSGPTPTPGTPPGPSPTPAAGILYDFAANACSAVWFSGAGQLPCPGTDGDARGFVLKLTSPQLENGTVDPRLGLLAYPQNVTNGYIHGIFPPYHVKAGDRFRSIVNCAYGATSCYVIFYLDYQTGSGPITTFWAFVEKYEGQYYQADLDLSPLVGQDVKFILKVFSTGSPVGDRAVWVAPVIYNSLGATSTPVVPTATGTSTAGWNTYQNVKYAFSFKFPPGSSIASQSDNAGRVYLPFGAGTNLVQKYLDVSVVEGATTCKSPGGGPVTSSENIMINGIQFLKEIGSEGAAGNFYDTAAYSTVKGNACISLTFVLHSIDPGVLPTPPPTFDLGAESAVFSTIVSTFTLANAPSATNTPPAPTATNAAASISIVNLSFQPSNLQVKTGSSVVWTNNDGTAHTVTSDTGLFDSGTLATGASFSFMFTQTGTFPYHCNIHTSMHGTITVVP